MPLTLLLPPFWRALVGIGGLLGLHFGIALALSSTVAIVFMTTFPTYMVGFGCEALPFSPEWWFAASIGLVPSAYTLLVRRRLLPEDWPSTPCSLFMWNGLQAQRLARLLMTGRTRLVLATREVSARGEAGLVGLPVLHHGGSGGFGMGVDARGASVHDAILRVLSFTLVHADLTDAFDDPRSGSSEAEMIQRLLGRIEAWLMRARRLFESSSQLPLTTAFFVRIDEAGAVEKVLVTSAHLYVGRGRLLE